MSGQEQRKVYDVNNPADMQEFLIEFEREKAQAQIDAHMRLLTLQGNLARIERERREDPLGLRRIWRKLIGKGEEG